MRSAGAAGDGRRGGVRGPGGLAGRGLLPSVHVPAGLNTGPAKNIGQTRQTRPMEAPVRELLAQYLALLHADGPGSPPARDFLDAHRGDPELLALARLVDLLHRVRASLQGAPGETCSRCGWLIKQPVGSLAIALGAERYRLPVCLDCLELLATDARAYWGPPRRKPC